MKIEKMTIKFPKVRGERLIIAALIIILITEAISTFWHLDKLGADEKFHLLIFLVDSLQSFGFFLLVSSLITTGIRKMRSAWSSLKGIAMLLIGLCLCAIPLLSVYMFKQFAREIEELPKPHFDQMEAMMNKGPLNSRIKLSKMYARDKYLYEGVTVYYITENGEQMRYVPTKEDIEFRNLKITTKQNLNNVNKSLPIVSLTWFGIAAASLLMGALTPIQKTAPNTHSDHNRA
jgi:hypothetical protein